MRLNRTLLAAALGVLSVASAGAETPGSEGLRAEIDRLVAPYLEAGDFMGVIGFQRDGEEPRLYAYGRASVELDVAHTVAGEFRIGSISKQFTAAAILLLEEDGRLTVGDRVGEHLASFGHPEVTIEQLLTHTSGIADVYSLDRFGATAGQGGTFEEVVDDLGRADLTHAPGTAYAYSNGGPSLAGDAHASEEHLLDVLQCACLRGMAPKGLKLDALPRVPRLG